MLREKISPDDNMPVLYIGEPGIDVLLSCVRLSGSENSVEVGGVGFVLPVMLKGMNVRGVGGWHRYNLTAD